MIATELITITVLAMIVIESITTLALMMESVRGRFMTIAEDDFMMMMNDVYGQSRDRHKIDYNQP